MNAHLAGKAAGIEMSQRGTTHVVLQLRQTLRQQYLEIYKDLTPEMQAKDQQLYLHSQRVLSLTLRLLRLLDLSREEAEAIALAAFFHDIGKLLIDDALLQKPGALTYEEFTVIQQHPALGVGILSEYDALEESLPFIYHHHERWDGDGYPDGLAGDAIPPGARIIAITDAFDAMTSRRAYQSCKTPHEAVQELVRCAGSQFDERLVRLFVVSCGINTAVGVR